VKKGVVKNDNPNLAIRMARSCILASKFPKLKKRQQKLWSEKEFGPTNDFHLCNANRFENKD
jgi:hypothetical protein